MASFEERIYELGAEALAEQERQVVETRGRGTAIIAAAAVIASLLAKPVFHSGHPHGFFETVPKLPQTIFNLEKRGGNSGVRRVASPPRSKRG